MAWISVHEQVLGMKLRELSKVIGCSQKEALGILVSLWLWGINNANRDGLLKGADKKDIIDALSAGLSIGLSVDKIVDCLLDYHWLDKKEGGFYLHDWDVWQEQWYKALSLRNYNAQRKRAERSKQCPQENPMDCPQENPMQPSPSPSPSPSPNRIEDKEDIYSAIVEHLNKKAGTAYKHSSRKTRGLIQARLNENFILQDFYTVIDKKVTEWTGTEWQKFIRPETLFSNKFEGYLNQKVNKKTGLEDFLNDE